MKEDKFKEIFSDNLKFYMIIKNKIQDDFVRDLNINKSTISSWCNGTRIPKMDKIQEVATYLGINISDLLNKKDPSRMIAPLPYYVEYIKYLESRGLNEEDIKEVDKYIEFLLSKK